MASSSRRRAAAQRAARRRPLREPRRTGRARRSVAGLRLATASTPASTSSWWTRPPGPVPRIEREVDALLPRQCPHRRSGEHAPGRPLGRGRRHRSLRRSALGGRRLGRTRALARTPVGISSPGSPIQPITSPAVTVGAGVVDDRRARRPKLTPRPRASPCRSRPSRSGSPSVTCVARLSSARRGSRSRRSSARAAACAPGSRRRDRRRTVATIRSTEGRTASSSTGAAGAGTSKLATRLIGASSESRHSSATRAATSAPQPPGQGVLVDDHEPAGRA